MESMLLVIWSLWWRFSRGSRRDATHLAVIDVTDGSDVDMRLGALEGSGVAPGRVDELCLAPGTESRLDGVGGLLAQSARGAEESPGERHDAEQTQTPAREE
jgi:hypothetical protein